MIWTRFRKILKIAAVILISFIIILLALSFYLSPQDKLEKTDAIIVISGGDTDARIKEGVELYFKGYAQTLIFSGAAASGSVSNAQAMKNIAISHGVKPENILIEETSETTAKNAQETAKIIKEKELDSIILVTSPYHQRRAYVEFRKNLGDDFTIVNHSALDKDWRKNGWWESSRAVFLTVTEILKNVYFVFQ